MTRGVQLPVRVWIALVAFAAGAVLVASIGLVPSGPQAPRRDVGQVRAALAAVPVITHRSRPVHYDRTAFGTAWADGSDAQDAGNGCDTRNDILDRDLRDKTYAAVDSCPRAVASGELRSPYTGDDIDFRRGKGSGADVQIDHIVPLSYAWDMGAARWDDRTRLRFANDPANLVAVDGQSNQDKSDSPPSAWMPEREGFACQYAVQFVTVLATYRLSVDAASVPVLRRSLDRC